MKRSHRILTGLALFAMPLLTVAAAYAGQAGLKFFVNGSSAGNVRMIDGQAYVPLKSVASALNMTVQDRPGGVELIKAGGAGQIANANVGRMGDEVFTGKWRFSVRKMERMDRYKKHLTTGYQKEIEAKPGMELLVVTCRVKNGTAQNDKLVIDAWKGSNTALTDKDEHAYPPDLWDVRADDHAPEGASFLPGAAVDFNLVFMVPKGAEPKDLVFSAIRYDDRASFDMKKRPPTDIRYSLSR
jgi:hypothetical protein